MIRKRGMMQLPFGMIFAIFLIVLFIVVAFIVINHFLSLQREIEYKSFLNDFQTKVDEIWAASGAVENDVFTSGLPSGVNYICFANLTNPARGRYRNIYEEAQKYRYNEANLFAYPLKSVDIPYHYIEHINVEVTETQNPYCIEVENRRIRIMLDKTIYENLVRVS